MKVLLVDDDVDLLDVTAYALRRDGFNVLTATNGLQAIQRWRADRPDVVVLDAGIPRQNGFEVCRHIRQDGPTPIVMLTALNSEEHVIQGFRMGADDYVTKPFSPRQLSMRIRAVARRASRAIEEQESREVRIGDLHLEVETHELRYRDSTIRLTPIECRLLHMLLSNVGRVVSSSRLVDYAWSYDAGDVSLLKTHVCHIRKKLDTLQVGLGNITAIPNVGYRFTATTE